MKTLVVGMLDKAKNTANASDRQRAAWVRNQAKGVQT